MLSQGFIKLSYKIVSYKKPLRVEVLKKTEKLNLKMHIRRMSYHNQVAYHLKNHKKKSLFFAFLGGIIVYNDMHNTFYNWAIREPFSLRFKKWLYKEKIQDPYNLLAEPQSTFRPEIHKQFVDWFISHDFLLFKGVPRYALLDIGFKFNWLEQKRDKKILNRFHKESGYRGQDNSRQSSMSIQDFLNFLKNLYDNSQLSQDEFAIKVMEELEIHFTVEDEKQKEVLLQIKEDKRKELQDFQQKLQPQLASIEYKPPSTELDYLEQEIQQLYSQYDQLYQTNKQQGNKQMEDILKQIQTLEKKRSSMI